jgi:AraC-like DNA-binding protein
MSPDRRPTTGDSLALYGAGVDSLQGIGIVCSGFGLQRIGGWVRERTLDSYAAAFVDDGGGALLTPPGGEQAIIAPALFWLFPGVPHSYGPANGTSWHERWVLFGGGLAEALQRGGLLDPVHPVSPVGDGVEVAALYDALHSDFLDTHRFGPVAAGATVHRLVAKAAQRQPIAGGRPRRGDLDAAMAALRERAFGPIDLAALAAEFGFSPAAFRRRMHESYGAAPKALLMQWRCARAKELLATTELSVEVVAQRAGFDDPYYFSRVFTGREGLSASAFRRRHRRL